ncbi:PRC-barrel domain-containing protein [Agromyces aerolatus]|uniref:PRC-barrel domain-containing protein n=1 Tax=Agromyces sp. LY-1074 TaxID=3074080 RepID=UPI002854C53E|nr:MULTISPECIES: PRC-barrel domain-containing protein [unclassified Agromyces]MDR5699166.1 PRC-barrel domain-containing protein [Agromyces sp. LY-1074]MDR5705461.1 PRC-barrel domain-containing protein [Agromyces sp. LY-1358]
MILGDLLGLPVRDARGERLGHVIDVRFVIDGVPRVPLADARLAGFVVSPRTKSSYWGYERTEETRPALIARYLAWRHRGTFLVPWSSVARLETDAVHLLADHEELDPAL